MDYNDSKKDFVVCCICKKVLYEENKGSGFFPAYETLSPMGIVKHYCFYHAPLNARWIGIPDDQYRD